MKTQKTKKIKAMRDHIELATKASSTVAGSLLGGALLRDVVAPLADDRYMHPDLEAANILVRSGDLVAFAGLALPGVS